MTLSQLLLFILSAQVAATTDCCLPSKVGNGHRINCGATLKPVAHNALLHHIASGNMSLLPSSRNYSDKADVDSEAAAINKDDERHDDGGHRKKTKKGAKKKKKKKNHLHHHGFFLLMKKMKKHLPGIVHKMHGPSMFMMGMAQANFHNFVMHALMMSKMALTTVVVMILREMVFGDKDQPVKYYNFDYNQHHRRTLHPSPYNYPQDYEHRRKHRQAVVA